jgi:hypothetical protein
VRIPVELSLFFDTIKELHALAWQMVSCLPTDFYRIRSTPEFRKADPFLYLDRGKKDALWGRLGGRTRSEVQLEKAADWLTIHRLLVLGLSCQA